MSNFFVLELDLTGPTIEILAPSYTARDIITQIRITSNEDLGLYQDISIQDSKGKKVNLIFNQISDREYYGEIVLNELSVGIAKIEARLKDEVDNFSNTAVKHINILESSNETFIIVKAEVRKTEINGRTRKINLYGKDKTIKIKYLVKNINLSPKIMPLNVNNKIRRIRLEAKNE